MTEPAGPAARAVPSPVRALGSRQHLVAVALLLVILVLALAAPVSSAAVGEEDDGELTVEVTGVNPPFLVPGQPLTVTGTLTNGTRAAVPAATLELRLQGRPPGSRFALNAWLDPDVERATQLLVRETVEDALPAGASRTFSLSVSPEDLPLGGSASAWGPRGLLVSATASGESGRLRDADRTLVVWYPEGTSATATTLTVVVPLAPTAPELLGAALGGMSVAEASGERVASLAGATGRTPQVTWALDPALLEGDTAASTTEPSPSAAPTPAGTSPQPDATPGDIPDDAGPDPAQLAARLRTLARDREIVALPYADADAAALVHGGQLGLHTEAVEAGREIFRASGLATVPGVAWPAATTPDTATVNALAAGGVSAVVLPESVLPVSAELAYTPTGRGTVLLPDGAGSETAGTVGALLAEEALSGAMGGRAPRSGTKTEAGAALAARQYVLALTALVSRERPSDPRHLLAAVPRTFDGDPEALGERLAALAGAPWVRLAPLSALRSVPDPELDRAGLAAQVVEDGEAPPGLLQEVALTRMSLNEFATIAAEPSRLVHDERQRLLQVTSATWRADPGGRSSFTNVAKKVATDLPRQVAVLASGTVNLISESGELPVTVRNGLDQPISALLRLTPHQLSLQVPDIIPVEVPAGSEIAFPVPVSAVGSADVPVDAELTDRSGRPVGEAATLFVRVRADWENVGTALVAAAVLVTFVLGLVRSIRRARRRRAAAPVEAVVPG